MSKMYFDVGLAVVTNPSTATLYTILKEESKDGLYKTWRDR